MKRAALLHRCHLPTAYAGQAGFTLVELMVAMTGGLFLSIVVFALSRDASRFYQQETRVANATLSGVTGFERLSNDLARAGHLASPNVTSDPHVCNRTGDDWPFLIRNLRAVVMDTDDSQVDGTEISAAGIAPTGITVAGALDVTEELTITAVIPDPGGSGFLVSIRDDTPAAERLGILPAKPDDNEKILQTLFLPGGTGRAVRVVQVDGMEQYGVVSGTMKEPLTLKLAAAPALVFRDGEADLQCGILGNNTGGSVNAVNFIHYELRPMTGDVNYKTLFEASRPSGLATFANEDGRVELVRSELKPEDPEEAIEGTREIVAEYAVDLRFSLLRATSPTDSSLTPAAVGAVDATYNGTQFLRTIHARLSVRSREADRAADVAGTGGGSTDLYRVALGGGGGPSQFARVRTFQSDIALRNLEGASWL